MIKRVDKVKRVAAISVIALMISLTGCGKSKDSSKEVTTKQINNELTSNQGESVSGENDEAINELLNNIEVNGKHIDFPFTLNDLGDGFEFDNYVDMGDGTYGMDLIYNNNKVAIVYIYATDENKIDKNSVINEVTISETDAQIFKVNNINCSSDINDVDKKLTALNIKYSQNGNTIKLEDTKEENMLRFYFNEENKVGMIILRSKGE